MSDENKECEAGPAASCQQIFDHGDVRMTALEGTLMEIKGCLASIKADVAIVRQLTQISNAALITIRVLSPVLRWAAKICIYGAILWAGMQTYFTGKPPAWLESLITAFSVIKG